MQTESMFWPELLYPTADRLKPNNDAAPQQNFFYRTQAQWKPEIQPDRRAIAGDGRRWRLLSIGMWLMTARYPKSVSGSYPDITALAFQFLILFVLHNLSAPKCRRSHCSQTRCKPLRAARPMRFGRASWLAPVFPVRLLLPQHHSKRRC